MGRQSDAANQIITIPQGGGALQGIGEKFSADLYTGTGNFTVPIAVPPGRNGFQPQLSLVYSTGNGNGPFGLGWSVSVPGVTRKTSKGIPKYDDSDVFTLSGSEDLVPVTKAPGATTYRPRTEGLFARITHYLDANNDYWEVRNKDGLISIYGTPGEVSSDPAVISDPAVDPEKSGHVFAWKLSLTTDPFENRIEYSYLQDSQNAGAHLWDQLYLSEIRYADYGDPPNPPQFLVKIRFTYDGPIWRPGQSSVPPNQRLDSFSSYRAGFEIRTVKRCTQIDVFTEAGSETLVRSYHLIYQDQVGPPPLNGASLLSRIIVEGHDGANSELLPPLEFNYTEFKPKQQKFIVLKGADLPTQSLADPSTDLVDLFGQGLPDVLEMNGTVRYWRNRGNGTFDLPRPMRYAPAGVGLADADVQIIDADGDGRADLLVTTSTLSGYYPLRFGGSWDRRSFQQYRQAPSFSLKDPEVRLVDLDGDGVTDAIRSGTSLECYFNDPLEGWNNTRRVPRKQQLDQFPNVNFSDPRVKWADMTGDGLQDIVLVYDGVIQYWPNLGYGNWGERVTMVDHQSQASSRPHFPYGYDPKRILLGDVDGDGAADLVYVDDMKVTRWSQPIVIEGTPPVSDTDSIRLADIQGNGTAGILWTSNLTQPGSPHMFFLDLTGGTKPYLLNQMNNHMGSTTQVTYKPSTWFFLEGEKKPETRWITPLPFPVQVVARVETSDQFSGGRLTTEYSYHHGYWDGYEREFRGFGRVDHRDTEVFNSSVEVPPQYFSQPTLTRTWFHQGAIGDSFDGWVESDSVPVLPGQKRFADEYYKEPWPGAPPGAQVLSRPPGMINFIAILRPDVRRDAFRSIRGKVLRTELYALDGTPRQNAPYTITEHVYGVREESPPALGGGDRLRIFFPFMLSERTTQWERGNDPLSRFTFTDNCTLVGTNLKTADYDSYGNPLSQISVAVGRGRIFQWAADTGNAYLVTRNVTTYAQRDDNSAYIVNRISSSATYGITNDGSLPLSDLVQQIRAGSLHGTLVSLNLNFYDGDAYASLPFQQIGTYGALTRSETLAFTTPDLQKAYGANLPLYLSPGGPPNWIADYPQEFRDLIPSLAGYTYQPGGTAPYVAGYYRKAEQRRYDFQDKPLQSSLGLLTGKKDAVGHETTVVYDQPYQILPVKVENAAGLRTQAAYDYRVLQPNLIIDSNGNQTSYGFSPLGLLERTLVRGQVGQNLGDTPAAPGTVLTYTLMETDGAGLPIPIADLGQPVSVKTVRRTHHASETDVPEPQRDQTIQTIEYSDGFGRVLQTRTQAESVLFDSASPNNPLHGDAGLPADQSQPGSDAVGQQAAAPNQFVVVSGWQIYDNKGQVVEKYEPFFSTGWGYAEPSEAQLGQKTTLHYDPRAHVIRTVNPDASEQTVIYGVPGSIAKPDVSTPEVFEPTPWEAYTYDAADNAGRTHAGTSTPYEQCWNTPSSILIDALGRTTQATERNRNQQADGTWSAIGEYVTASTYDIVGNLLTVTDPLGRTAFTYNYDLMKRALSTFSIDAGTRTTVPDAAGNTIEERDSKSALILHSYDALNRPIRMWARDTGGLPVTLREKIIYGDDLAASGLTQPAALAQNLLGKPYKHYDEAGLLTLSSYDFKGNLLEKTRNVITETALLAPFNGPPANWIITPFRVDWSSADLSFLDTTNTFLTTTSYDAVNRIKTTQYPKAVDGSTKLLVPRYNLSGALESVQMDGVTYVDRIAYNAKGQRILISYGNGFMTRYTYDPRTFRLLRLRTENYTLNPATVTYHPSAPSKPLQDFGYEYDLVGNILEITDRTPSSGIVNNPQSVQVQDPVLAKLLIAGDALIRGFAYDPVYRLISATGRECDVPPPPPPWNDSPRCVDITSARPYTECYQYDNVGNMRVWKHNYVDRSGTPSSSGREFTLATGNNQLAQLAIGTTTNYQYTYDPSGNLVQENTERHFEWDEGNRMRIFRIQPNGAPPSVYAQYLYDSSGQRVMKLARNQNSDYETTICIDGIFEVRRRVSVTGTFKLQNNSLHVMDNQKRVAIVRVGPAITGDGASAVKYQFGDHLGSSNVVVDDTGAWLNREEYLPYGETSFGSFSRKRYRFTGKERDEESGLYYHGARYHAPWLGRWTTADIPGLASGLNLYCAFQDNPLAYIDPSGHSDISGTPDAPTDTPPAPADNISPDEVAGFTGGPTNCPDYHAPTPPLHSLKFYAGTVYGTVQTLTPGGFLAPSPLPESREFEMGRAAGQQATGGAMMVAGMTGEVIGGGADVTGVGAVIGVPLGITSAGVIAMGAAGVAAGAGTAGHAMSLPDDSAGSTAGKELASERDSVQTKPGKLGPTYKSFEEAKGKGEHIMEVVVKDENGNEIAHWWEASEKGSKFGGHTEQKALARLEEAGYPPGTKVEFRGSYQACPYSGGCHNTMDAFAQRTGIDITYRTYDGSIRDYVGGYGFVDQVCHF
jgi:RHS repeat-associated protein